MTSSPIHLTIVTPVYNDWESLVCLLRDVEIALPTPLFRINVTVVDDRSRVAPLPFTLGGSIERVDAIRLTANVGHQRAIAVGLVHVDQDDGDGFVAVMDSDGEDRPDELRRMVDAVAAAPDTAIVAHRKKRSESLAFKLFYFLYVQVFRLLTGRRIDFGNFSVLSRDQVRTLVHNPNIWNHFAATVLQSKIPLEKVPTRRGRRYAGQSTMNFVNLVTHGLGAVSVFSDAVLVRVMLLSLALFGGAMSAVIAVLAIRSLTDLAVPGWATTVLGFAVVISLQAIMMPVLMLFQQLNARASFQSVPKSYASLLIESIACLYRRNGAARATTPGDTHADIR